MLYLKTNNLSLTPIKCDSIFKSKSCSKSTSQSDLTRFLGKQESCQKQAILKDDDSNFSSMLPFISVFRTLLDDFSVHFTQDYWGKFKCVLNEHLSLYIKVHQRSGFLFILQTKICSNILVKQVGIPWDVFYVTLKKLSYTIFWFIEGIEWQCWWIL